MTTKTTSGKTRQRYSRQYKAEPHWPLPKNLVFRQRPDNWLHESQLYNWRIKARLSRGKSAVEERLLLENARFKRQLAVQAEELAIIKNAAACFAKSLQ